MLRTARQHLTYANIMASLAVFAVLGGGMAVAAGLKKNSVRSKTIKDGAVAAADLGAGSVTTDKLANDAATGAKVDEATLGQVPSAAQADSAQTATSAQSADSAQTANSANSATNAANANLAQLAQDSNQLGGNTLGQVRSTLQDDSATTDDPLTIAEEQVDGLVVNVAGGAGNTFATATVVLTNNGGAQAAPECRLRMDGTAISQQSLTTLPAGHSDAVTLIGMTSDGSGQVTVDCAAGSAGDDQVRFIQGDMVVQKAPTG